MAHTQPPLLRVTMAANRAKGTALSLVGTSLVLVLMLSACSTVPQMTPCSVPPPDLANGTYAEVGVREVQYFCNEEFWLSGPGVLTCTTSDDGKDVWLPDSGPECFPSQDCHDIELENGGYDGECCRPGDIVSFYCEDEDRFKLWGAPEATCLQNGLWNAPIPTCQDLYCKDPGHIENGVRRAALAGKWYNGECCPPDTVMVYECFGDYQLEGEVQVTCGENGTWTHRRPKCRPPGACDNFELENGQVSGDRSGGEFFAPGDSAFITCDRGFKVNGTDQLFCDEDGQWDEEIPSCIEYNCTRFEPGPHLQVDEFIDSNKTAFPEGSFINFRCDDGYLLDGVFSSVCRNGGWFGRMPKCEQIRCGALRAPNHGWMSGNYSTALGSTATFGCFQGYKLQGSDERECESDGQWSGDPRRCVPSALAGARQRNGCLDPGAPDNGRQVGRSAFLFGSRVKFACNPGYHMRGNDTITCQRNGNWTTPHPRCIGKFYYDKFPDVRHAVADVMESIPKNNVSNATAGGATARILALNGPNAERHYVYFLFDASTSIGPRNFRTGINLAKAITKKVNVTLNGHRVGAIVFTKDANLVINPLEEATQDIILQQLDNIPYTHGGTSINSALLTLQTSIADVKNFMRLRHPKEKIKFAAFLITDGKANIGGPADKVADGLRGSGNVELYCIGITGGINLPTLKKLASNESNVFILRKYDALQWLAEKLTNGTVDYGKCGLSYSHDPETGLEGDDRDKAQGRIFGGTPVETAWPWMVEISTINNTELVACGGTIIKKNWILTAAHCTHPPGTENESYGPTHLRLRAGLIKREVKGQILEIPGEILDVESILVHEDYNRSTLANDIALLKLKKEIAFKREVRPICLPPKKGAKRKTKFYKAGETAFVIGWGVKEHSATKSAEHLLQLQLKIGTPEACNSSSKISNGYYPEQGAMCAISSKGDSCKGDSGGPLMQGVEDIEKTWTQVGIVSWGQKRCDKNKYSFYTDVSHYLDWITQHTENGDAAAQAAGP